MKKKKNLPDVRREAMRDKSVKKPVSPETKKKAAIIAAASFVNMLIYFGVVPAIPSATAQFSIHIAYMLIFSISLVIYIIYNRAFTRKNITIDMLPDVWSAEQKAAYILDGEERLKKSQWLMYIIIPFLVPIGADALVLFVWDPYLSDVFSSIVGGIG